MKASLVSSGKVSALVVGISCVTNLSIDGWIGRKISPAELTSTALTSLALGGMFFWHRWKERRHYHTLYLYDQARRQRQHRLRNHLNVIMLHDPPDYVQQEVGKMVEILNEPVLPKELEESKILATGVAKTS